MEVMVALKGGLPNTRVILQGSEEGSDLYNMTGPIIALPQTAVTDEW